MPDTSKLEKLNRELEKSEKKLRKAINDEKALQETAGLIMRVRQGVGEPHRIYVLIPGKEDAALA